MARSKERLIPDRLTDAADAAMRAAIDHARRNGGASPCPADLMGTSAEPACLLQFTNDEVLEACEFLVRLGFLKRPRAGRAA